MIKYLIEQRRGRQMFYEEKTISDNLCWRNCPGGPWHRFNSDELTLMVTELRELSDDIKDSVRRTLKNV